MTLTITLKVPDGTTEQELRAAIENGCGWTLDRENFGPIEGPPSDQDIKEKALNEALAYPEKV
mgnify:CR=1 FL=1|jgi:hypothetical protein